MILKSPAALSRFLIFAFGLLTVACSPQAGQIPEAVRSTALRPLTQNERLQDFDTLASSVREFYGPLRYKEKRFGFEFETLVREHREQVLAATSDIQSFGVLKQFLAHLHDGHVSLTNDLQLVEKFSVPLFLMPLEDRVVVSQILDQKIADELGIQVGDEVLAVDGKKPLDYLPTILKYEAMGNEVTDRHFIFRLLSRPTYIAELLPTKPGVLIAFAKPDGKKFERNLIWKKEKGSKVVERTFAPLEQLTMAYSSATADLIQGSLAQMGTEVPFFATPQVESSLGFTRVVPSEVYLKKYGMTDVSLAPKLYAALSRSEGKNILTIRISSYQVPDSKLRLIWYKALLEEYGRLADVLVIDQTHNPGGDLNYANQLVSLFAKEPTRGLVNFLRADRRWMGFLGLASKDPSLTETFREILQLGSQSVESAYDQGLHLTSIPISLSGNDFVLPAADFQFSKPILVLVDELAGSCGDMFPALMKENGLAQLFGERTIGLGGNVEPLLQLPFSQASLNLTRGLFAVYSPEGKYDLENPIENNGVTPNVHYQHTIQDFRAGYVQYVTEFSKAAVALIKPKTTGLHH